MRKLGLRESDIEERFVRSPGPGGQYANKVSTCVQLCHLPSGIEIKCKKERSQRKNRLLARILLVQKIEAITLSRKNEEKKRLHKIKVRKRQRSQHIKEEIRRQKTLRSRKKILRKRIITTDE
jgi:protein subunit release factor B